MWSSSAEAWLKAAALLFSSKGVMASCISQSSFSSIPQYKSQSAIKAETAKKCISSALLKSPLFCDGNLGLTQFSFFLSLSFFTNGQVGEEKSPTVCTLCSHIWRCCSSTSSLFYLLQRKRSQNKLSSTLLPERQKVKVCGLWHFKAGSGQRRESECSLQLPARGGRWIQSWREAEESCLIQPETSLGWTCVRTHTAAPAPALGPWAAHCSCQTVPPTPPDVPASTVSALPELPPVWCVFNRANKLERKQTGKAKSCLTTE